jgi:hypothetical protein
MSPEVVSEVRVCLGNGDASKRWACTTFADSHDGLAFRHARVRGHFHADAPTAIVRPTTALGLGAEFGQSRFQHRQFDCAPSFAELASEHLVLLLVRG